MYNLFVVALTVDGGVDGTRREPASYTYTVRSMGGDALATKVSPLSPRTFGATCPGTYGMAFYDANRELRLLSASESPRVAGID